MRHSRLPVSLILLIVLISVAGAKDNWIEQMHKLQAANATNPNCKLFYKTGEIVATPTGSQVVWGMTEKMWKWYSTDGVKKYPSACLAAHQGKADVEIIFNLGGTEQIQGADLARQTETSQSATTFNANMSGDVNGNVSGIANTTTTSTTTTAVPYTRTFKPLTAYVYRAKDGELIGTSSMVFTRQIGGNNAGFYNLGAAIGSSRHLHKMFEETLELIVASGITDTEKLKNAGLQSVPTSQQPLATKNQGSSQDFHAAIAKIQVESNPSGADIEIDGSFVGNTPSDLQVPEGVHTVAVKRAGFMDWLRTVKISSGSSVHLSAELEAKENR